MQESTERLLSHPRRPAPTPVAAARANAFDPDTPKATATRVCSSSVQISTRHDAGLEPVPDIDTCPQDYDILAWDLRCLGPCRLAVVLAKLCQCR